MKMCQAKLGSTSPRIDGLLMSEITPPRNLTPGMCKKIEAEMLKACAEVAAKHGLVAEGLGLQAMDLRWSFEFGVRVSIPLPDGSTLDP